MTADGDGRAGHVALHVAHARGGLDAEAAGVEGQALAYQRHALAALARLLGLVREVDEPRLVARPAPHGLQELHARLTNLGHAQHLAVQARLLGELLGGLGEARGGELVGRLVDEVAGAADGLGDGLAAVQGALLLGAGLEALLGAVPRWWPSRRWPRGPRGPRRRESRRARPSPRAQGPRGESCAGRSCGTSAGGGCCPSCR
jgi:hypothetical protein